MTKTIQRKLCLLGTLSVGKTSLVRRFVDSAFSERYQTTIGVKVDKKVLTLGEVTLQLMIWDLEGTDDFNDLRSGYLRGTTGYVLVVDGTRPASLDHALVLQERVAGAVGAVPFTLVLNKCDLVDAWQLDDERIDALRARDWTVVTASARTGEAVEPMFADLGRRMLAS